MHVIATAGHVDHGKSTLVRALTGMEPDRWAEERRRGMTIDLGFAWFDLPPAGSPLAFVDVPGHERFVTTMLAGAGPVPAVMFVVAADEGWMPQSAEHLAALDAMGVRHGLLVVTRSDLADPGPALKQARTELRRTSLGDVEAVAVSGRDGTGLPDLVTALGRLTSRLPASDPAAPVRLWIDRAFTIKGSGTVVTGTLGAGTVRMGDELQLGDRLVRVRGLQALKEQAQSVPAVARVALNLRGVERADVARGMALVTPGKWRFATLADVRLHGVAAGDLPREPVLHIGSASVSAGLRPLGEGFARLTLAAPLPLHVGDRALLRDPGTRRVVGVTVLDVLPAALRRSGAAAARARDLATWPDRPDAATLLADHGLLRATDLEAMGAAPLGGSQRGPRKPARVGRGAGDPGSVVALAGDWLVSPGYLDELRQRLAQVVERHAAENPLEPGVPVETARQILGLPDRRLVESVVEPPLRLAEGRVHRAEAGPSLPEPVAKAVREVCADLAGAPFHAPGAGRLAELGLTGKALAAAVRAGTLLRIADGIVLAPGADDAAAGILAEIRQPFTASEARTVLDTSRRVAIPLLEHLDRRGLTERLPDDRRRVRRGLSD